MDRGTSGCRGKQHRRIKILSFMLEQNNQSLFLFFQNNFGKTTTHKLDIKQSSATTVESMYQV